MDDASQPPLPPESGTPEFIPPVVEPQPSFANRVFIGPQGLRPLWRFLIYVLLFAACAFGFSLVLRGTVRPQSGQSNVVGQMVGEIVLLVSVIVPAIIMGIFEKRSLRDYGLPGRSAFGKHFWVGLFWGVAAVTVLIVGMRGAHAFYFGNLVLHGARLWKWALWWGIFFLFVGFFEEFSFRGYTQFTLTTGMGFWPAALLLSFLFGAIHLGNPGEAWVGGLSAGLIGLFLAFTLRRTGSLWWAVGFHQGFDWGETFLYSVPNSGMVTPGHLLNSYFHGPRWLTGGSIGPEGSVLVFVLILLLFVVFDRVYRQAKWPLAGSLEPKRAEIVIPSGT